MIDLSPRIRTLLRQANRTAESGKRVAAENLYRDILAESPECVEAWLGVAKVVTDPAGRTAAYRQVLALDPHNEEATLALNPATATLEPAPLVVEPAPMAASVIESVATPAPLSEPPPMEALVAVNCYRHPQRKTNLRCYSCGRPICIQCAKHTPVGYRCPPCIHTAQDVFFEATPFDYGVATVVGAILAGIGGAIIAVLPLGFFVIFIGPFIGSVCGRIVHRLVGRRRGRYLPHLLAALVGVAGLAPAGILFMAGALLNFNSISLYSADLLWTSVYAVMAASSAYYQLR